MSAAERITAALAPLGLDTDNGISRSEADEYIVFRADTLPTGYADDRPQYERALVQVHYYAPAAGSASAVTERIKRALFDAGFTWPAVTDASDADGRHLVFECEDAEWIDYGDNDD